MRQYSIDDKGVEHIVRLFIENWWVADRESYVMLTPSSYNIDAWEDTDALLLTRADFLNRLSLIAAINEMTRKMDENSAWVRVRKIIRPDACPHASERIWRYSRNIKTT